MFFVSDSACICGSIHFSSDGRNCRVHPVLGVQTYCRKTNTSRGVLKGLLPAMSDIGRMSILLQGFDTRFGLFRPFSNPTFQHRHHKSSFRHPVLRMLFCKLSRYASTSIAGARTWRFWAWCMNTSSIARSRTSIAPCAGTCSPKITLMSAPIRWPTVRIVPYPWNEGFIGSIFSLKIIWPMPKKTAYLYGQSPSGALPFHHFLYLFSFEWNAHWEPFRTEFIQTSFPWCITDEIFSRLFAQVCQLVRLVRKFGFCRELLCRLKLVLRLCDLRPVNKRLWSRSSFGRTTSASLPVSSIFTI